MTELGWWYIPNTYFPENFCDIHLTWVFFFLSCFCSSICWPCALYQLWSEFKDEWMFKGLDKSARAGNVYLGADTLSLNLRNGAESHLGTRRNRSGPWKDGNVRKSPWGEIHRKGNSSAKSSNMPKNLAARRGMWSVRYFEHVLLQR